MKITHRITPVWAISVLIAISSLGTAVNAQPAPELVLDRAFRYESSAPTSQGRGLLTSLEGWIGNYQRIRKEGSGYVAVFDRGSLPLDAKFKSNGSIESMTFGCPMSRSVSINDAPTDIRKALSKCGGFKSRD
jgi:hypothetical protein